jgi:hypothetical protein
MGARAFTSIFHFENNEQQKIVKDPGHPGGFLLVCGGKKWFSDASETLFFFFRADASK